MEVSWKNINLNKMTTSVPVTEEPAQSDGLSGWAIAFIVTIVIFYLFGLVIGYLDYLKYRKAKDYEACKRCIWAMVIPFGPIFVSMLQKPGYADIMASPVTGKPPTYDEFLASRSYGS
jgi:NhaP-type Na+/H+ or K+/H+ antiporter